MSFQNSILASTVLMRSAIRSPNFVTGVSGWTINQDGTVEFSSGTFRGTIKVADGSGGYTQITSAYLELHGPTWATVPGDELARILPLTNFPLTGSNLLIQGPLLSGGASSNYIALGGAAPQSDTVEISAGAGINLKTAVGGSAVAVQKNLTVGGQVTALQYQATGTGIGFYAPSGTGATHYSAAGQFVTDKVNSSANYNDAHYYASSPGGSVANVAFRTLPLASQIRVGNAVQDFYFRNLNDTAYCSLQAASFVIGSREETKRDVVPLGSVVGDALDVVRQLRPIRYVLDVVNVHEADDVADRLHVLARGSSPAERVALAQQAWRHSTTMLGFTVEDLAALVPELIHPAQDGSPGAGYSVASLLAVVVAAVQQLDADVQALTNN